MRTARHVAVAALSTALAVGGSALSWTPAHGEPVTCQGLPVTVEGIVGTEGDDVMRRPSTPGNRCRAWAGTTPSAWSTATVAARDPMFFADAGPGDDVVVYEATYPGTVLLGAGADRFIGNDVGTSVYTGAHRAHPGGVGYFGQADTEATSSWPVQDATRSTPATPGASLANPDRISTGDSTADTDSVFYAGRMTDRRCSSTTGRRGTWCSSSTRGDRASSSSTTSQAGPSWPARTCCAGQESATSSSRSDPTSLRFVGGPARRT